jgi:hypothetical protein
MPAAPSGNIQVNGGSYGEFDECLHIASPINPESDYPQIRGKYCYLAPSSPVPPPGSYTPGEPIDMTLFDLVAEYMNKTDLTKNQKKTSPRFNITAKLEKFKDMREIEKIIQLLIDDTQTDSKFGFGIGLCLPSICHAGDIEKLINKSKCLKHEICFIYICN